MKVQITDISFDCSLDDSDWSVFDQVTTEDRLSEVYGTILGTDDEEEMEISSYQGAIKSIDYRHILK